MLAGFLYTLFYEVPAGCLSFVLLFCSSLHILKASLFLRMCIANIFLSVD